MLVSAQAEKKTVRRREMHTLYSFTMSSPGWGHPSGTTLKGLGGVGMYWGEPGSGPGSHPISWTCCFQKQISWQWSVCAVWWLFTPPGRWVSDCPKCRGRRVIWGLTLMWVRHLFPGHQVGKTRSAPGTSMRWVTAGERRESHSGLRLAGQRANCLFGKRSHMKKIP